MVLGWRFNWAVLEISSNLDESTIPYFYNSPSRWFSPVIPSSPLAARGGPHRGCRGKGGKGGGAPPSSCCCPGPDWRRAAPPGPRYKAEARAGKEPPRPRWGWWVRWGVAGWCSRASDPGSGKGRFGSLRAGSPCCEPGRGSVRRAGTRAGVGAVWVPQPWAGAAPSRSLCPRLVLPVPSAPQASRGPRVWLGAPPGRAASPRARPRLPALCSRAAVTRWCLTDRRWLLGVGAGLLSAGEALPVRSSVRAAGLRPNRPLRWQSGSFR